jgi:hypothetical protein
MADMPEFHPGRAEGSNVLLPVSGSRHGLETHEHQGR